MLGILPLYGSLAVSRLVFQVLTSVFDRRTKYKRRVYPQASMIVAVFNEDVSLLEPAFKSFKNQSYKKLEVVIIDDGSKNRKEVKSLSEKYGFEYAYQKNAGKREAMYHGFRKMRKDSQIVFTADSDTIWDKHAARNLARTLLDDKKTGAVTGEVAVLNNTDNFLTRLIDIRYHLAFTHERASQSLFGTVTCISGPLGAYRRELIDEIKESFINQYFLGKKCTYGDDRHLTNLVLSKGRKVKFSSKAIAWTYAPTKLSTLIRQQTRWSKSYWREIFWQRRVLSKHGIYLTYDWVITMVLPFALLISLGNQLLNHPASLFMSLLLLIQTIVIMGILRIVEPIIRTRRPIFIIFVAYSFIYFAIMLPVKFYALATMNNVKWGTR